MKSCFQIYWNCRFVRIPNPSGHPMTWYMSSRISDWKWLALVIYVKCANAKARHRFLSTELFTYNALILNSGLHSLAHSLACHGHGSLIWVISHSPIWPIFGLDFHSLCRPTFYRISILKYKFDSLILSLNFYGKMWKKECDLYAYHATSQKWHRTTSTSAADFRLRSSHCIFTWSPEVHTILFLTLSDTKWRQVIFSNNFNIYFKIFEK